jgi:hypothetical protein
MNEAQNLERTLETLSLLLADCNPPLSKSIMAQSFAYYVTVSFLYYSKCGVFIRTFAYSGFNDLLPVLYFPCHSLQGFFTFIIFFGKKIYMYYLACIQSSMARIASFVLLFQEECEEIGVSETMESSFIQRAYSHKDQEQEYDNEISLQHTIIFLPETPLPGAQVWNQNSDDHSGTLVVIEYNQTSLVSNQSPECCWDVENDSISSWSCCSSLSFPSSESSSDLFCNLSDMGTSTTMEQHHHEKQITFKSLKKKLYYQEIRESLNKSNHDADLIATGSKSVKNQNYSILCHHHHPHVSKLTSSSSLYSEEDDEEMSSYLLHFDLSTISEERSII